MRSHPSATPACRLTHASAGLMSCPDTSTCSWNIGKLGGACRGIAQDGGCREQSHASSTANDTMTDSALLMAQKFAVSSAAAAIAESCKAVAMVVKDCQ